jgi:peptide deformylase
MSELIRLQFIPTNPNVICHSCGLTINLHAPYGDDNVTVLVNPSIESHNEHTASEGIEVAFSSFVTHTEDTKEITLNFTDKNVQSVMLDDKEIELKLMNIGKEKFENQDFPYFEIYVSEKD